MKPHEKITLRDIWKNFNVSLIMILPIFWDITNGIKSKTEGLFYPFVQLAFDYGLLNTFLYKGGKFNNSLYLLFDKEIFRKNLFSTTSRYYSICELVVDCKYYKSIQIFNDYVLVELEIPKGYEEDIKAIEHGLYSQVSERYKRQIKYRDKITSIPVSKNAYGIYIVCNDLAYAISIKAQHVKNEIDKIIGINVNPHSSEFYSSFDGDKENFDLTIIAGSKELLKYSNA